MSQAPTPYERQKNFVSDATNNPSITVPQIATGLDAEFVAVQDSLNDTINRLGELQRDDGALRDAIVSAQNLSPSVVALLALNGVVPRGAWTAAVVYAQGDVVGNGGGTYLCVSGHTANADFSVDQVAGLWLTLEAPFNNSISVQRYTANGSQVAFSLGGSGVINATNVFINGVYQNKDTYSIDANTNVLTFGEAPPSGAIVEIIIGAISPVTAVVPDLSISTAKIANSAITSAKIADGAVTPTDLASVLDLSGKTLTLPDSNVTTAKIANSAVTTPKLADGSVTAAKIDPAAKIGGATGAGTDRTFYENDQTVNTSYTITAGKNAMSAGPITIADGISVTIPDGSTYTVV
jgi:hypothetical protein